MTAQELAKKFNDDVENNGLSEFFCVKDLSEEELNEILIHLIDPDKFSDELFTRAYWYIVSNHNNGFTEFVKDWAHSRYDQDNENDEEALNNVLEKPLDYLDDAIDGMCNIEQMTLILSNDNHLVFVSNKMIKQHLVRVRLSGFNKVLKNLEVSDS